MPWLKNTNNGAKRQTIVYKTQEMRITPRGYLNWQFKDKLKTPLKKRKTTKIQTAVFKNTTNKTEKWASRSSKRLVIACALEWFQDHTPHVTITRFYSCCKLYTNHLLFLYLIIKLEVLLLFSPPILLSRFPIYINTSSYLLEAVV